VKPTTTTTAAPTVAFRDLIALGKPRITMMVLITTAAGIWLAPSPLPLARAIITLIGVALIVAAANAFNMYMERDVDALMSRTRNRPLPAGRMERSSALQFGVGLGVFSVVLMGLAVNLLSAAILTVSILFYVLIYTVWLKRRTPQNIVIGGAAGAFPALIGWAAVTDRVDLLPVLLFLLVFLWTPPHFWALSLFVNSDYAAAGVPMMSVVAGPRATRLQALLYSLPMAVTAILPWPLGLTGPIYGLAAVMLNAIFLGLAVRVGFSREEDPALMKAERRLFAWSILYLFATFGVLVVDRLWYA